MSTLLLQPTSFSVRKQSLAVGNGAVIQSSHCSPQPKGIFAWSFTQSLLSLVLLIVLFGHFLKLTTYDGLGRRIQTSSGGNTVNYYYDPEVEFLELGNSINGNHFWNLYGPNRSGVYGGAQGIGGLECTYNETSSTTYDYVKNFFGDTIGIYTTNQAAPYASVLGGYGPMPGSDVNHDLEPQKRGRFQILHILVP